MAKSDVTKKKVEDALLDILSEKNVDEITVGEFIEYANVSRSTFYRYYHDIYDVYDSMIEKFAAKCMTYVDMVLKLEISLNDIAENVDDDWSMKDTVVFSKEDHKLFSQVIYSDMSTRLLKGMIAAFSTLFKKTLTDKGVNEEKADFYSLFILGGLLSLYSFSLKKGNHFSVDILESAFKIINNCN